MPNEWKCWFLCYYVFRFFPLKKLPKRFTEWLEHLPHLSLHWEPSLLRRLFKDLFIYLCILCTSALSSWKPEEGLFFFLSLCSLFHITQTLDSQWDLRSPHLHRFYPSLLLHSSLPPFLPLVAILFWHKVSHCSPGWPWTWDPPGPFS